MHTPKLYREEIAQVYWSFLNKTSSRPWWLLTGKRPSQSTAGGDVEEGWKHLHHQSHVEGNTLWKLFDAI